MVVARESNHFGAAAWWAAEDARRRADRHRDVQRLGHRAAVAGQGRAASGTNPICVSVPGPWLLDMATTTVAAGKIFKAMINDQPEIPAGWAFDSEGVPTTNTDEAYNGGMLMPLGGYKGSGLAMMVEILCAVLGRRRHGHRRWRHPRARPGHAHRPDVPGHRRGALHAGGAVYRARGNAGGAHEEHPSRAGLRRGPGGGRPRMAHRGRAPTSGIPIADGNWDTLCKTAAGVNVPIPALRPPALQ